jgi:Ni,Fe-hydrogenase maturation factor
VALVESSTDLLGLIDVLDRYALVVLVDALLGEEGPPSAVALLEESMVSDWHARSTSAHRLSPVEALRVFRALKPDAATRIVLVVLHTDEIGARPLHARPAAIREGVRLVRTVLAPNNKKGHPGGCPSSS